MLIPALAFYLFATVLTLSALMVITARNPVHSVLFLIMAFFNASGLFLLLGAEFVALILVIVYVGAVAVLFLFVVMMLDIDFAQARKESMQYVPVGLLLGAVLLGELFFAYNTRQFAPDQMPGLVLPDQALPAVSNTKALGHILYTDYIFAFQVAGLILLVAMIGAIVLTHRVRPGVRKQQIAAQVARKPHDVLQMHDIKPGTGA